MVKLKTLVGKELEFEVVVVKEEFTILQLKAESRKKTQPIFAYSYPSVGAHGDVLKMYVLELTASGMN